jgi:ABC-type glycerol-3-phosphate transport system permease component
MKGRRKVLKWCKYIGKFLVLLSISIIVWIPIVVVLFTSFKHRGDIVTASPSLLPKIINFDNYIRLFEITNFQVYLTNSLMVAGFTAIISLLVSSLGAYATVWLKFKGKNYFIGLNLFVYIFPQILLVIPLFLMCYKLQLLDTKFALVLTYLSFILPFGIWLLRNYFQTIPKDLVEAALIDGCNHCQCLIHVVLPICLPVMATVLTYSFVLGWNEYLFANILIKTDSIRTVAIGVQTLVGSHGTDYGLLTAAAVVMIIPVIIMFIFVQRLFIDGLAMGSVKE